MKSAHFSCWKSYVWNNKYKNKQLCLEVDGHFDQ